MSNQEEIDPRLDYLAFRNDVVDKFGLVFAEAVDLFFERAVEEAKSGLFHSSIRDAQFACSLEVYENESYALIYLIGFLCQVHLDAGEIGKARAYLELGYKMLDKNDSNYEDDKASFDSLKAKIDGDDWKDSV